MSVLKRVSAFFLATALVVSAMQVQTEVQAATSAKTVKKAYLSYLKKKIANCSYDEDINYNLFDFNKDGVKELVVSSAGGARGIYDIYTYKNKKVVSLVTGQNEVGYIKGKKYVVTYGSGGATNFDYTVYKMKKRKLVKVTKYACVDGVYKKNGKNIEKSIFTAFANTVNTNIGKSKQIAKKYYSPKNIGFSVLKLRKKYTKVTKATNKKVYYYYYKLGDEQRTTWKSKTKSAKITSKTKFYYGDKELLFTGTLSGKSIDTKKWIYKISKKQFINKMKDYNETLDTIVVKNGKVVKVVIHTQIAG